MNILIINILNDKYIYVIDNDNSESYICNTLEFFKFKSYLYHILYHRFIIQNILEKFIVILSIKYHFPSYIIKHSK